MKFVSWLEAAVKAATEMSAVGVTIQLYFLSVLFWRSFLHLQKLSDAERLRGLDYKEIYKYIAENGYYHTTGKTPVNTLNSVINRV